MSYTQSFIVKLLETFIKESEANFSDGMQIISYQNLDKEITLLPVPTDDKWKLCYLFYHAENIYHALVITPKIRTYIFVSDDDIETKSNLTKLIPIIYKTYGRSIQISLSKLSLDPINAATGFIEAIRQFLLQEKINELDIRVALVKDVEFCIKQLPQKLKKINFIKLICAYDSLIKLLSTQQIDQEQYKKIKKTQYQKIYILEDYLTFASSAELLVLIKHSSSEEALLIFLENLRKQYLALLLKAEQGKFLKPTGQQRLKDLFLILYYTSVIGTGDTLSTLLTFITKMLLTGDFKPSNPTTKTYLLRAIGMMTGAYFLMNGGIYSAIKPPMIYFGSQLAQHYLNTETFNDATGEVISSYLNYPLDNHDWYLLISNLFLLAEATYDAFYFDNPRSLVYAGANIITHLLFLQLVKWFLLPLFKDESKDVQAYIRMSLMMFTSFCSRLFSNAVVDYGYAEFDDKTVCVDAQNQFKESIQGQIALELQCHYGRTPFWRAPPKLEIHATNNKGQTFQMECDTQYAPNKLTNCKVTKEYPNKLLTI